MNTLARSAHSLFCKRALWALTLLASHGALAATSCPPAFVEGVDVSNSQGAVTWSSVQGSGRGFAYAFATQGNTITDARFGINWPAIKTAGLLRGAIHFFDPTIDGVTQANYFLAAINSAGGQDKASDLPAALDLECPTSSVQGSADANCVAPGNSGWVANGTLVQRVFDWLTTVHNATGKRPVIYTYPAWYGDVGFADLRLARYPVYTATYAPCADVPAPWATAAFWQYSQSGTVPGIAGSTTYLDRYVGTAAALQGLVEKIFTYGFEGLVQVITFTSSVPASPKFGGTYNVSATANSALPVTIAINGSSSGVCSIGGSTVSFIGVGTCVVDANQAGDATWSAAPLAQQSFVVGKANQTVAFTSTAPVDARFGGTYNATATATSGLAVALTIDASATSVCSISAGNVSFTGLGTCVINANQPGNANYLAAPQVQQSFLVSKADQTLNFTSTAPADAYIGGPAYVPTATATSGLAVTLTIDASSTAGCDITAGSVTFGSSGTCVINANQPGNTNYNAAPQVQQSFAVSKTPQTINFTSTAPSNVHVGDPDYVPTATATSSLPVTLSIDVSAASVCSINGGSVSFIAIGNCVINADQAGDATYSAAPQVQQSIPVAGLDQTISFTSTTPVDGRVGGPAYAPTATATSSLPVALTVDASSAAVCSISGGNVSFTTAGNCVIDANQAGDTTYNPAPQVQQSFVVIPCISLNLGEVVMADMPGGAAVCVNNVAGIDTEYTYLPINLATSVDSTLSLFSSGIQAVTGPPTPRPEPGTDGLSLAPLQETLTSMASQMHGIETPAAFPANHVVTAADLVQQPHGGVTPLVVGQLIDLNASVGACGVTPDIRKGRVEAITTAQSAGQKLLYAVQEVVETTPGAADWHPPVVGGYTAGMLQSVIDSFVQAPPGTTTDPDGGGPLSGLLKTGSLDVATNNFGAMTDLDANGGLILFFTPKINSLSPPASSAVVQGMFQARDMFSSGICGGSNQGEILYLMVPDPTGVVNSNVRTVSSVYGSATTTLVHFYEHLLSAWRRTYAPGGPFPVEAMWLDEALAWQSQELTFWNTSVGLAPRGNVQLSTLTTGPNASVRVNDFNTYENLMYGYNRTWFYQLPSNKRVGPVKQMATSTGSSPTVHENAAQNFSIGYTFIRYALDRKNTGDAALLTALVNSSDTGLTNLQNVFGQASMNDWVRDFLVAAYTDDAVAGVAPQYTMPSWNFRSVYGGLGGFPLVTNPLTNNASLGFVLGPGGGTRYARFGIPTGGNAYIGLTEGGVAPNAQIATALVRTK